MDPRNWRVLVAAYVLPPLTVYVAKRHVIRRVRRWRKARQVSCTFTVMLLCAGQRGAREHVVKEVRLCGISLDCWMTGPMMVHRLHAAA